MESTINLDPRTAEAQKAAREEPRFAVGDKVRIRRDVSLHEIACYGYRGVWVSTSDFLYEHPFPHAEAKKDEVFTITQVKEVVQNLYNTYIVKVESGKDWVNPVIFEVDHGKNLDLFIPGVDDTTTKIMQDCMYDSMPSAIREFLRALGPLADRCFGTAEGADTKEEG